MRSSAITISLAVLASAVLAGPAAGRFSDAYDEPVSGTASRYGHILASDDGEFERWGTAPSWSEEEQVGFLMPDGGPWLLWLVQVWMSGTSPHRVILRQPCQTIQGAPCAVIDESITFTPGYPAPPDRWVTVDLLELGLMLGGGEEVFVGVSLDGSDDGIGLDTTAPAGHSWGWYGDAWEDNSNFWGAQAAIRLILTDTSFDDEQTTWGAIKALFRPAVSVVVLTPSGPLR